MAYIITSACIGVKDASCVDVCPVDCIHPRKDEPGYATSTILFIHPDECIDCGACVPACPVEAIFALDEVPAGQEAFIEANAAWYEDSAKGEALVAAHVAGTKLSAPSDKQKED
jgi:NAD-dependent dihydropyrimidine dehydrogenase PreA subunit